MLATLSEGGTGRPVRAALCRFRATVQVEARPSIATDHSEVSWSAKMSLENDVHVQILSDPDFDWIVAEVSYKEKYMFLLSVKNEHSTELDIYISDTNEVQSPFVGRISLDNYISIINLAKEKYLYRITEGPNPFERNS